MVDSRARCAEESRGSVHPSPGYLERQPDRPRVRSGVSPSHEAYRELNQVGNVGNADQPASSCPEICVPNNHLELPHVARPQRRLEQRDHLGRESLRAFYFRLRRTQRQESNGKRRNVLPSLGECRQSNHAVAEPVAQLLEEGAPLYELIGRLGEADNHAAAQSEIAASAQAAEKATVENPQQQRLGGTTEVMKIVEQQCSVGSFFERADSPVHGSCERAALVTKELTVLQVALEFASGVRAEGAGAVALRVDQLSESGFPTPGGSHQDERRERAGVGIGAAQDVQHRGRLSDEIGEASLTTLQRQSATTLREPRSMPQQVGEI